MTLTLDDLTARCRDALAQLEDNRRFALDSRLYRAEGLYLEAAWWVVKVTRPASSAEPLEADIKRLMAEAYEAAQP
jgi:hypothetical protein